MNEIKNKIMMDLTNTVIHCPTEELAKKVLEKAHGMGYKWRSGYPFLDYTYWEDCKEETCYWIERGRFGDLKWYKDNGFKIISAEEFLNVNKKVYYRGDAERGAEIIKALEKLGGENIHNLSGDSIYGHYFIGENNEIQRRYNFAYWLKQAGYTEAFLPNQETITIEGKKFTLSAIKKALGL